MPATNPNFLSEMHHRRSKAVYAFLSKQACTLVVSVVEPFPKFMIPKVIRIAFRKMMRLLLQSPQGSGVWNLTKIPPKSIRTKPVFFYEFLENSKNAGLHQQTSYFWQTIRFHGFLVLLVGTEFHKSVNCSVNHVEMIWAQNLLSCSIHNHCFPSMFFVAVINGVFSHFSRYK